VENDDGPDVVIVTGKIEPNQHSAGIAESEDALAETREQLTKTKT
jgi:hypothetical protein